MRPRILVTGCTGLVGHGICNYFISRGYELIGTSRYKLLSSKLNFTPVRLDLSDKESIRQLPLNNVDAVIHNAAQMPNHDSAINEDHFFKVNLRGTQLLLKMAFLAGIKHFIYISGTAIVDNIENYIEEKSTYQPINPYYSSKAAGELVCNQYRLENKVGTTILRIRAPFGYCGSKYAVIPRFITLAEQGKNIELWGSGNREQLFTFVEDIGLACRLALEKDVGGTFNIVGPETINMKVLAEKILDRFSSSKSEIIFTGKTDPEENQRVAVNMDKARKILGFEPVFNIDKGLDRIVNGDKPLFFDYQ